MSFLNADIQKLGQNMRTAEQRKLEEDAMRADRLAEQAALRLASIATAFADVEEDNSVPEECWEESRCRMEAAVNALPDRRERLEALRVELEGVEVAISWTSRALGGIEELGNQLFARFEGGDLTVEDTLVKYQSDHGDLTTDLKALRAKQRDLRTSNKEAIVEIKRLEEDAAWREENKDKGRGDYRVEQRIAQSNVKSYWTHSKTSGDDSMRPFAALLQAR